MWYQPKKQSEFGYKNKDYKSTRTLRKLNWEKVAYIRSNYGKNSDINELCKKFGVSKTCIRNVITNNSWRV